MVSLIPARPVTACGRISAGTDGRPRLAQVRKLSLLFVQGQSGQAVQVVGDVAEIGGQHALGRPGGREQGAVGRSHGRGPGARQFLDQDGLVEMNDEMLLEVSILNLTYGYVREDLNGDWISENSDYSIIENNIGIFSLQRP